jgi:hypothetical protein
VELSEYNGWENKFTWLVHLHLSNEQSVMHDMVDLVARTSDGWTAGRLVEQWVQAAVNGWVTGFPHRDTSYEEQVRLLVWDLAGSALAYADWDVLVKLLMGQKMRCDNPFTWTLHKSITTVPYFQQPAQALWQAASSPYAYADALHERLKGEVDAWITLLDTHRWLLPAVVMLVHNLLQDTYGEVCWEHVARAFRAGY